MGGRRRIVLSGAIAGALVISLAAVAFGTEIIPGTEQEPSRQPGWQQQAAEGDLSRSTDRGSPSGGSPSGGPASAGASTGPGTRVPTATTLVAASESIAYLRKRYGLSEAEAVRRIELQQASTDLAAKLAETFPQEYAGMWLDQAAGGVLKVGMTAPEKLAPAVAGFADASSVRAVPAKQSLRKLTETAQQIAADLGVAPGGAVAVDVPGNSVVVTTGDTVRADHPRLAALLAAKGARVQASEQGDTVEKSCDPLHCAQAPMRGGIRLDVPRDDGTVGGCTAGFNLRSATTGALYVLIAGHCVRGGRHTRVDDTFHEFLGARIPVNLEDTGTAGLVEHDPANARDYAILPYAQGAQAFWWTPGPRQLPGAVVSTVNYRCPGGCEGSHDVRITGHVPFASIQVGWVVCASGAGYTPEPGETYVDSGAGRGYVPGTRCGEITGKDSRIIVRICARPGDSGGPLFTEADGKALGILNTGDPGSGACTNAAERNWYMPVSTILDRANSANGGVLDLRLLTAPVLKPPPPRLIQP
jgi:hypothetical protein